MSLLYPNIPLASFLKGEERVLKGRGTFIKAKTFTQRHHFQFHTNHFIEAESIRSGHNILIVTNKTRNLKQTPGLIQVKLMKVFINTLLQFRY